MLDADVQWVGLAELDGIEEIAEDGITFAENARKKALGYAKMTGLWTIADDSGLVVDALGGQPGVKSARFSGVETKNRALRDRKNMEKVLKLLEGVPRKKRTGRFVCHLVLASSEEILAETEGHLEGFVAERQAGENGFGYDPIFFVSELGKTVAQISRAEKNEISHRGKAIRQLKPQLNELLQKKFS